MPFRCADFALPNADSAEYHLTIYHDRSSEDLAKFLINSTNQYNMQSLTIRLNTKYDPLELDDLPGKFPNLTKFTILGEQRWILGPQLTIANLTRLVNLRILRMRNIGNATFDDFLYSNESAFYAKLSEIHLDSVTQLQRLPAWISGLRNITRIAIVRSFVGDLVELDGLHTLEVGFTY